MEHHIVHESRVVRISTSNSDPKLATHETEYDEPHKPDSKVRQSRTRMMSAKRRSQKSHKLGSQQKSVKITKQVKTSKTDKQQEENPSKVEKAINEVEHSYNDSKTSPILLVKRRQQSQTSGAAARVQPETRTTFLGNSFKLSTLSAYSHALEEARYAWPDAWTGASEKMTKLENMSFSDEWISMNELRQA